MGLDFNDYGKLNENARNLFSKSTLWDLLDIFKNCETIEEMNKIADEQRVQLSKTQNVTTIN